MVVIWIAERDITQRTMVKIAITSVAIIIKRLIEKIMMSKVSIKKSLVRVASIGLYSTIAVVMLCRDVSYGWHRWKRYQQIWFPQEQLHHASFTHHDCVNDVEWLAYCGNTALARDNLLGCGSFFSGELAAHIIGRPSSRWSVRNTRIKSTCGVTEPWSYWSDWLNPNR